MPEYTTLPVTLSDGSYADMKVCKICANQDFDFENDENKMDKIRNQFVKAFEKSGRFDEAEKFKKLKVLKKTKGKNIEEIIAYNREESKKYKEKKDKEKKDK
jgi:hypothetical protein